MEKILFAFPLSPYDGNSSREVSNLLCPCQMDKYRLVQEHKANETDDSTVNPGVPQVRITQQGKPRNYISYAMNLFVSLAELGAFRRRLCLTISSSLMVHQLLY